MNDFHDMDGMDEVDRRIAAALHAAADQVDEHSLRPALSPRSSSMASRRHIRWTAPLLAAAAVVAVVVGTVAVTSSTSSTSSPRHIPAGSNPPDSMLPASTFTLPATPSSSTGSPQPLSTGPHASAPPMFGLAPVTTATLPSSLPSSRFTG